MIIVKLIYLCQAVVTHAFNPSTWKAEAGESLSSEFDASPVYRVSSRTARATQKNPVSEKKKRTPMIHKFLSSRQVHLWQNLPTLGPSPPNHTYNTISKKRDTIYQNRCMLTVVFSNTMSASCREHGIQFAHTCQAGLQ